MNRDLRHKEKHIAMICRCRDEKRIHVEALQTYFQQIIYWAGPGSPLVGATAFFIPEVMRKKGWIKKGDMTLIQA